MVQVLPYIPTFGERLIPALADLGNAAGTYVKKRYDKKAFEDEMEAFKKSRNSGNTDTSENADNSGMTPMDKMNNEMQNQSSNNSGELNFSKLLSLRQKAAAVHGEKAADSLINSIIEQQKLDQKEAQEVRKEGRAEERKYSEAQNLPFFEKLAADKENLPSAIQSNEQVIDAILKGNVGPGSLPHVARIATDLGAPNSITKMLESTDSKEFNNGIKGLMGHTIKDTFRGTTTQREIDIAEAMQAEIGVKPQANLAAAWAVQSDLMIRQEKMRLADELLAQGVSRSKIPAIVDKKLQPYRKNIKDQYFQAIAELRKEK